MNKSLRSTFRWLLLLLLAVCSIRPVMAADASTNTETKEQRDARMAWWRDARFGMFIHWGVYSVPAGVYHGKEVPGIGEWIMSNAKIPMAEYQTYAKEFDPVKFNADKWVKLARDAGMKYIVITSKHHDGFAMFNTKASDWNIVQATPFGRDPLKELAAACRKYGLKLGFYYSQAQDWNNGGAACNGKWDPAQQRDMDDYIDKVAVPQVKELLSNYGKFPAVLWWDTPCDMTPEGAAKLNALLQLKPGIITNNRLGGGFKGDTETPEQKIPATGFKGRDWETCMTMNDTWGFKSHDNHWKSVDTLGHNLIDIASKGGNYLLNVGPTSEGLIPEPSVERLHEIGAWMKVNGQAIYGTSASPFARLSPNIRCTRKPGKLYVFLFNRPADGTFTLPLTSPVKRAYLLAHPKKAVKVEAAGGGAKIILPDYEPDPIATVVVLEVEGEPQVAPWSGIPAAGDGSFELKAEDATIHGSTAHLEQRGSQPNIGYWVDSKDFLEWNLNVGRPQTVSVQLTFACAPGSEGSEYEIIGGGDSLSGKVVATGSWNDFQTVNVGNLKLSKPGPVKIIVRAVTKPGAAVMDLQKLLLKPVPSS